MWHSVKLALSVLVASVLTIPLLGQGIVNPVITGNVVTAQIQLPGGIGADLTLSFEQVEGLDLSTLGMSAELADLTSNVLQGRLPVGGLVGIPSAFPVLLRIRPTPGSALAFHGIYSIALHTENLGYLPGTPLRLFRAPDGGLFKDISQDMGSGSYRVRGTGGSFSEFLIVSDLRTLDSVILQKFDDLQSFLDSNAGSVSALVLSDLRSLLVQARTAYTGGDPATASQKIQAFLNLVVQHSGLDIPDVYRAGSATVNVAGGLRAGGTTLLFSLGLKTS